MVMDLIERAEALEAEVRQVFKQYDLDGSGDIDEVRVFPPPRPRRGGRDGSPLRRMLPGPPPFGMNRPTSLRRNGGGGGAVAAVVGTPGSPAAAPAPGRRALPF